MKNEKRKTLKGSVLFTVVSVMTLLIVFLSGALVLASAANNRAHKSYSQSQASYTARAAIQSFTEAMQREVGIVAAIQNMRDTDKIYPDVVINDKSLGHIGYYDETTGDFVEDKIVVEAMGSTKSFVYNDLNNKWEEVVSVKISATARVGKEEETVTAYIKKRGSKQDTVTNPSAIKGLQTAGAGYFPNGGTYTGGLGVGLSDTVPGNFSMTNATTIETALSYINGSFNAATSTFKINVVAPLKPGTNETDPTADTPYSQTIIMGDLKIANNEFVNLNYEFPKDASGNSFVTQKDIPYLYVDGKIDYSAGSGGTIVKSNNTNAAFNIFAGSWDSWGQNIELQSTDLYLMDSGANNRLGNTSSTALKAWATSVIQKDTTQFDSNFGGSIYCNGNLELSHVNKIDGDVRVQGNCTIRLNAADTIIDGNLVVKGTLFLEGGNASKLKVTGAIYCDQLKGSNVSNAAGNESVDGNLNAGYQVKDSIHHSVIGDPEILEVPNKEYPYYKFSPTEQMPDYSGKMGLFGENVGWANTVYYYWNEYKEEYLSLSKEELVANGYIDGASGYIEPQWNTPDNYYMECEVIYDEFDQIQIVETNVITGETTRYYHVNYNEYFNAGDTWMTRRAADDSDTGERTYSDKTYYDPAGNITTELEAFGKNLSTQVLPYSDFTTGWGDSAYPQAMTREAIYGEYTPAGAFKPADASTKIIRSLEEVRKELGMDEVTGEIDAGTYPKTIEETGYATNASRPGYENGAKVDGIMWNAAGEIVDSCTIHGKVTDLIKINPGGSEIFVLLWDVDLNQDYGTSRIEVDTSGGGTVNFFIRGTLKLNGRSIMNSQITANSDIYYDNRNILPDEDLGIIFYGEENSLISITDGGTLCGSFKTPYTTFNQVGGGGIVPVTYHDENNYVKTGSPTIIGNAIFKAVTNAQNNFALYYTKSGAGGGGGGGGGGTFNTDLGWWELGYFSGS